MSCGEIRFLDGGIIKNAQILDSTLSDCLLSRCTFDSGTISNLLGIDEASAARIFDAFKTLDPDKLRAFARLLLNLLPPDEILEYLGTASDSALTTFAELLFAHLASLSTDVPDTTQTPALPTKMFGDTRVGVMGSPDTWVKFGNYLLPAYTKADTVVEESDIHVVVP